MKTIEVSMQPRKTFASFHHRSYFLCLLQVYQTIFNQKCPFFSHILSGNKRKNGEATSPTVVVIRDPFEVTLKFMKALG